MQESQSIEWKWSWQDDYLKWLCGYANTDGGLLYIGVNDDGYVVGAEDSKQLLEILPNKIRDKLGIIVSIRVYTSLRGDNIRYGIDIPKGISDKLVNQYVCGFLSTDILPEEDESYQTIAMLEKKK